MEQKVTLECREGKTGKAYVCLVVDLGYTQKPVAFGAQAAEIVGVSPRDLANVKPGDVIVSGVLIMED